MQGLIPLVIGYHRMTDIDYWDSVRKQWKMAVIQFGLKPYGGGMRRNCLLLQQKASLWLGKLKIRKCFLILASNKTQINFV